MAKFFVIAYVSQWGGQASRVVEAESENDALAIQPGKITRTMTASELVHNASSTIGLLAEQSAEEHRSHGTDLGNMQGSEDHDGEVPFGDA